MSFWRKKMKVAILAVGTFLLATASPAASMLCKMAMGGCPASCIDSQKDASQNVSFEAACPRNCCLTINHSLGPVIASELKNVSETNTQHLILFAFQTVSSSQIESSQAIKFWSPHHFHPPAPEVFLLKSSFLI